MLAALHLLSMMAITCCLVQDFTYDGVNGTSNWARLFPACGGPFQSPVALETNTVELDTSAPRLHWKFWNRKPHWQRLYNNGEAVVLHSHWRKDEDKPLLWFTGEPERFTFGMLAFHWGSKDNTGSEHTLNGLRYALEMQVFMYDTRFKDLETATRNPGATMLLAYLFQEDEQYQATVLERVLAQPLNFVRGAEMVMHMRQPWPLSALVPHFNIGFLRYNGSLTVPPCTPAHAVLVDIRVHDVSHEQMENFRKVKDKQNKLITHNIRPLQPLNGRKVTVGINESNDL